MPILEEARASLEDSELHLEDGLWSFHFAVQLLLLLFVSGLSSLKQALSGG